MQSERYLAIDRQYITHEELEGTDEIGTEAKRLINGMIAYLRKQD